MFNNGHPSTSQCEVLTLTALLEYLQSTQIQVCTELTIRHPCADDRLLCVEVILFQVEIITMDTIQASDVISFVSNRWLVFRVQRISILYPALCITTHAAINLD